MDAQIKHYSDKLIYEIDSWDLSDALKNTEEVQTVDARLPSAFATEHIPGAINLPHREISEATTAHLDKNILYTSYCDGIGCNASTKGALKLTQLGFKVKELMGGLDWWKRDRHPTEGNEGAAGKDSECVCG